MYALRAYINKSIFGKILLGIEKTVKTFSIPDKTFSKNSILLCALMAHVSKIHILIPKFGPQTKNPSFTLIDSIRELRIMMAFT